MTDKEMIEEMAKVLHDKIVDKTWRAEKVAEELYKINDMESEKVEEIKLALEIAIKTGERMKQDTYLGPVKLSEILEYINELESENEIWKRKAINYYQMVKSYGIECVIDNEIDETLKECLEQ